MRPLLNLYHTTKKFGDDLKGVLKDKLLPLLGQNERLTKSDKNTSVSDIVIWCDLYPLYVENSDFISTMPKLKSWMDSLLSQPTFKKGLDCTIKTKGNKIKWNFSTWCKKTNVVEVQPVKKSSPNACPCPDAQAR